MNGRENVDTRKSNCSAMTKPKDKISEIRNSTATMEESLTSNQQGIFEKRLFCEVLERNVHAPRVLWENQVLDSEIPKKIQGTMMDGRTAAGKASGGGLPRFPAVGKLKKSWRTWLQKHKSSGGYL